MKKMTLISSVKYAIKDALFPGLDLHTRNRALLARFWRSGERDVLDAGSGNGYFSYLAYKTGARVVALNYNEQQVQRAQEFFLGFKGCDPQRLTFEKCNLYELEKEARRFDEIICFEVLEHIRDDRRVLESFFNVLKPGGVLHLCCPNRLHPRHQMEVLDELEVGGHVRAGYTEEDYISLLVPLGFEIREICGVGDRNVYRLDQIIRNVRAQLGDVAALPLLPVAFPILWKSTLNPQQPFSIYARAVKPSERINKQHKI